MEIYIELSNFVKVNFTTGIQRVTLEITARLLNLNKETFLIAYNESKKSFYYIDKSVFLKFYNSIEKNKKNFFTDKICDIRKMSSNSIFFDIDGSWNNQVMRRNTLFPILKDNGVKIATIIYDIIPIMFPYFFHQDTLYKYLTYFVSQLKYSDLIITNTKAIQDDIIDVANRAGYLPPELKFSVVELGSDFKESGAKEKIDKRAFNVVKSGKYVICVGTIEPRKNHRLLLDAFDKGFKQLGLNLVFIGRVGWNSEKLLSRMKNHKDLDVNFFFLQNVNDITVDYLYKNAFALAFPSYYEGFGLPLIEGLSRQIPVIASDVRVLREVGKDWCDYFDNESVDDFLSILRYYVDNKKEYNEKKKQLADYKINTWDNSANNMLKELNSMINVESRSNNISVKQIVLISARKEALLNLFDYIENLMPFIKEVVIGCPNRLIDDIKSEYKGNLKLYISSDEELLGNRNLPVDHAERNLLLKLLTIKQNFVDNYFIHFDDDYRPLFPIEESFFINDNKLKAYYFYNLKDWTGDLGNPSSYDISMFKTLKFLESENLPTMQYSAHMPQIMSKEIWIEITEKYPDIETKGYDDWSIFFNYGMKNYPSMFDKEIYKTLCWPGQPSDWLLSYYPAEYMFENYYEDYYNEGGIFNGFSKSFINIDLTVKESFKKIFIRDNMQKKNEYAREALRAYENIYSAIYNNKPEFIIQIKNNKCNFHFPEFIYTKISDDFNIQNRIEIIMDIDREFEDNELKIGCAIQSQKSINKVQLRNYKVFKNQSLILLPVPSPKFEGEFYLYIGVTDSKYKKNHQISIPMYVK